MKLNLSGPITMQTGYGVVVSNFLVNLVKQGIDVTAWPLGNVDGLPENHDIIREAIKKQEYFDPTAPTLRIYHQFSMAESIGRGKRIGMPIFELDTFNSREKHHLGSLDHILVNTTWAREVVHNNGISIRTDIVPLGYDPAIFNPGPITRRSTVVFLNVGKWTLNKGHDVLKTAFDKAFSPADNVELWMCCTNKFLSEQENKEWERYYTSGPLGNKVRIIPWQETQHQLAELMRQADVGVFPARGEGWNLEALEMMGCGKPIVGTEYSGQEYFIQPSKIEVRDVEPAHDGKWFHGEGNWALLDDQFVDEFALSMRNHFRNIIEIGRDGGQLYTDAAREFTWEKSTEKLIHAIFRD